MENCVEIADGSNWRLAAGYEMDFVGDMNGGKNGANTEIYEISSSDPVRRPRSITLYACNNICRRSRELWMNVWVEYEV